MSKRTGERCGRPPTAGISVCKWHGGGTKAARAKAAENELERRARTLLPEARRRQIDDPLTELLALTSEVIGFKDQVALLVGELSAMRYSTDAGGEQLRAEIVVYERALDRSARTLVDIAKLNIEERLVQVSERRLVLLARAVERILANYQIDARDPAVSAVIARELRALPRGRP
jgi:hypothetical protein